MPRAPMNRSVLRLITRLNIGGPSRQALLLTKALAEDFPTVLAAGVAPPEEGELSDSAVPVSYVDLRRSLRPFSDLRAYREVRTLLQGRSILHTHMAKAGTIGRLAARRMDPRPRTVHTFHGHVLEGYFRPSVQRAFIEVERRLARTTDALVAVSDEVRDSLLDLDIGDAARFRVIKLGFDLSSFLEFSEPTGELREKLGVAAGVPLVGVLGRIAPIKNHALLVDAIARLDGVHLVVIGDGPGAADLKEQAARLGISDRFHLLGWCTDLPETIGDLDVMALSSRNEGTPVSLIEAAATGIPAVATDVGGVRTVVDDTRTGYLVPPDDPAALAERLEDLLSDDHRRAAMGAAARERVRVTFSSERLVNDIRALYAELLA